jgi:hypothetical protein
VLPLLIVCGVAGGALLALAGMPLFPSFVGEHRTRREAVRLPQSWVDERIRVAGSRSRARGLVADARIEAGETVIVLAGRQVPSARPELVGSPRSVGRILRIEDGVHLVQGRDDPATSQRHSCDPTTWLDGAFCLVARRRIEAHEAVTVDLATLIADPAWHRTCHCHAPACRGRLSGNDWMRPELQARYDDHFLPSIAARIGATTRAAT